MALVKKVCHVIDSAGLYGAERMLLDLAEAQRSQGIGVAIISLGNSGESPKHVEAAAKARGVPVFGIREPTYRLDAFRRQILAVSEEFGANVLHLHGSKPCLALRFGGLSFHRQVRSIYTLHGWGSHQPTLRRKLRTFMHGIALRHMDAVVAVSESVLQQRWASRTHNRRHIVTNGITSLSTEARERVCSRLVVLFVGRLIASKGVFELLEACALLRTKFPELQLWLVGEGSAESELRARAKSMGLTDAVIFHGFQQDVAPFYGQASCLALPSYSEGLPLCVLEAMNCQLPVVASCVGGIPDVLGQGRLGWLVEPKDVAGLASNLSFVLDKAHSDEVFAVSEAAKDHQETNYSARRMAADYLKIMESL